MSDSAALNSPFNEGVVYWVHSDDDDTVLVAIGPVIRDGYLEWFDTVRDRCFEAGEVTRDGEAIIVGTPEATYRFDVLTVEVYQRHIESNVAGSPRLFDTEQVQAFYREFPGA